ncbi:MAG: 3-phosphoglycerate dehydrogenase [Candidatus Micrarchaeota archaeon]|nr:3-phosphoglycerate dehydrogenase [Candidatus Micrarchaeota archaeon]
MPGAAQAALNAIVVDKVDKEIVRALRREGVRVREVPGIKRVELLKEIAGYEILIGRTRLAVDSEMIEQGKRLRIVGRAAVGTDNIDFKTAERNGIKVVNAPGAATESVAELALTLTFMALRGVYNGSAKLKNGEFLKNSGLELAGKTIGIVGFGRIGSRFAELLRPFNVTILVNDIAKMNGEIKNAGATSVEMHELLARSDIVSLHVNMEVNNGAIMDDSSFGIMKDGAILVNTVRAKAVDMHALQRALDIGRLGFYASDVLWNEPPKEPAELEIIQRENVLITPHIGAQTTEAQARVAEVMIPGLLEALKGLAREEVVMGFA